jgi:hypothetical protein
MRDDTDVGLGRFKRLRQAMGFEDCGTGLVGTEPYDDVCREFGASAGQLFSLLAEPEFWWMDGDHILALYKAWQAKHAQ